MLAVYISNDDVMISLILEWDYLSQIVVDTLYEMPEIEKMLDALELRILPQHFPDPRIIVRTHGPYLQFMRLNYYLPLLSL